MCVFLCFLQKQEKPKFVLCVTFAENGDAITGDSSGNILVWGKGTLNAHSFNLYYFTGIQLYLFLSLIYLLITLSLRLSLNLPFS